MDDISSLLTKISEIHYPDVYEDCIAIFTHDKQHWTSKTFMIGHDQISRKYRTFVFSKRIGYIIDFDIFNQSQAHKHFSSIEKFYISGISPNTTNMSDNLRSDIFFTRVILEFADFLELYGYYVKTKID